MFARLSNMFGANDDEEQGHGSPSRKPGSRCGSQGSSTPIHTPNVAQCQIDNSGSVLEKIAGLYAERLMSDIVLVVGQREFPAHRLILCASSDVFQVMLMNPRWNESREQRILLQEAPECVEVFELFLRYLYTGRLKISHSTVLPILALADKYNVKDLVDTCGRYMKLHVVSASQQNYLIAWLEYTLTCGHSEIAQVCLNHLKWNFEQVAGREDFASCDIDLLTTVLAQHDLVIHDEMTLYNIVVSWLHRQEERLSLPTPVATPGEPPTTFVPQGSSSAMEGVFIPPPPMSITPSCGKLYLRRDSTASSCTDPVDRMEWLTYEVMKFVRFPMMTPRQLADLLLVPLTIKYKEFFVTRMAIGMSFHSGQWDRVREVMAEPDPSNRLLFTPRLYTAEQWSASLTVDNLPGLPAYHTRTLVFSTPASASELDCDSQLEWIVELYPKGVWFRKFYLIVWQGTVEVPEAVLRTVRLAVTAKDVEYARVRIAVLVFAVQDGIEYIVKVVSTKYIFSSEDNLLNLDDILPFDSLNDPVERQRYLQEPCESLKIHIVISPLTDPKLSAAGIT
ncbi:BTB/POZ domain-containing protein 17-like [Penaeus japonicus]|uniref:BTB/POZ domain-containing protein 17-like n=1 Tax=Penaeus japonicus TaxID=27405 RepID=UPI001C70D61F|nr:BTB/POZ domain-containing protein 17-like [Penaeus japonicus]XP_042865242.1 BTB/POZ domain-containing protein 17-like [Penaeus japonicus]XP_042865243.1 BTB/POZ domain-containing protein 17-like [Penaeus japonicus]